MTYQFWPDERVSLLKEFLALGHSAGQIAAKFCDKGVRMTRNAVIGKVHRLHLGFENPPSWPYNMHRPQPVRPPKPPRAPRPVAPPRPSQSERREAAAREIVCEPVSLVDRVEGQCRWPIGDPREEAFRFCGAAVHTMDRNGWVRPYCRGHCELAYEGFAG